jgi:hypothetical protein
MPATDFLEYARTVRSALDSLTDSGDAVLVDLQVDQRSAVRGFIEGSIQFCNGSELTFREFLDTTRSEPRLMYAYHYQDSTQQLVFRYDNATHRPALAQPEHKHTTSGIFLTTAPHLPALLDEILELIGS